MKQKQTISKETAQKVRELFYSDHQRDCGITEWTFKHYDVLFDGIGDEVKPYYILGTPQKITWFLLQL